MLHATLLRIPAPAVHTALGSLEIEDLLVGRRCARNRFLASSVPGECRTKRFGGFAVHSKLQCCARNRSLACSVAGECSTNFGGFGLRPQLLPGVQRAARAGMAVLGWAAGGRVAGRWAVQVVAFAGAVLRCSG